ncbi:long-chain acyl-CoA synthetase [Tamaricihabitans halophyticus]|uniref:Long-chain acyl-CoA synthetase n=1 Tax=Tamaricihabitans halophyticus TaxID=1262583 RepID=A0A4R2PYW8_9PSEU|nr:AMP-binding protein [Tamaricihabitans halophyticus]TCP41239.1 long-chain acyl-CoA synthetase [Tamaricihabitans halophyticus]
MKEPFVRSGHNEKTLAEVKERAARFAGALRTLGLEHGDRYAIVLRNEIAYMEVSLGAASIGAVPVPVNWHWTGADLRHLLADSGAKVAVVHTDLLPAVEAQKPDELKIIEAEVPDEVRTAYRLGDVPLSGRYPVLSKLIDRGDPPADPSTTAPMAVIYTSGTTGLPKGILREPIPPENAADLVTLVADFLSLAPGRTTVLPAPLYHTAPNVNFTFAAALGMSMVIMPKFDADGFLRLVEEHRADTVQVVPTMLVRMLQLPEEVRRKYDLSCLKAVVHAAGPCPPDVKRAAIDWLGPIVSEYYGGSEGGAWVYSTSEDWLAHPGTVGKPLAGVGIRILGPDRTELPVGETGVIYGRPPAFWPNFTYIGNEDKRREIDGGEGYYTIGDIGYLDEDGFLYLTDRVTDMVVSGGVNVYPAEIEAALLSLEGVADVAVFGIPDPDLGEAVAAHVQLLPGTALTEQDVRDHVRRHLASYKAPKVIVFDDDLPREDTGKLFKRRLKARYWPAKTEVVS